VKLLYDQQTHFVTQDFDIQTLSYRAPEVLFGAPPLTPAIDMWSLGCILAELALGRLLFAAQTPAQLLQQMAAALGGPPSRALFGSGRLYDRVFRAAGLAPPGQAKALGVLDEKCGLRNGESEWGSENGILEWGSGQGGRTAEEGKRLGSGFGGEERAFGKGFGGSGKGLGGFGRPQVRSKLGTALSLIDPALADLVCWLLEYDPDSRPTPEQARSHPFFKPLNPSQAIAEALPLAEPVRLSGRITEVQGRSMLLGGREIVRGAFLNLSSERGGSVHGVFQSLAGQTANGFRDENQYLRNGTALPVSNSHNCRDGISEDSAKKRKVDLMAEVPADITADVARRDRRTASLVAAQLCENREPSGNVPEIFEDGVGLFTLPKNQTGAAHRPAAELKSTPLNKVTGRGSHWSAGEASLPPFCSTARSFGGQVAASFESGKIGKRSQVRPSLSEAGVGPESGNVKKWEEWNLGTGRKRLVGTEQERGPGSLVFVASAEAARSDTLELRKEGSRETVRGRPVAVHTRGDAGERVNTPGSTRDVSFAEGLVAIQGTKGPRKGADTLTSYPEIEEDAGRTLVSEPNAVELKRGVAKLGFLKGGVQTTAQLSEPAVETDSVRSGSPPLTGAFPPLAEKERIPEAQPGLGHRETRFGNPTPVDVTVRNKGPFFGVREVPVCRVGIESAKDGVSMQAVDENIVLRSSGTPLEVESGVTCGAGAVLKAPRAGLVEKLEGGVATAKFARGQEKLGAAPSEVGRRVTGGTRVAAEAAVARSREKCGAMSKKLTTGQECASLSDSPDSDSCGSAVISSPPSGEKRLDWAENKGEVVSSCKDVSTRGTRNLDSGGAEPAASELSLTVEPCRRTRAKRTEEGDTSPQLCSLHVDCTKVHPKRLEEECGGSGGQRKKRARRASHEEMESGEPLAGSTKWVRTKSARGSSEGRNATFPLQPQRVLPKRPAREEGNSAPWWIAVPLSEHGKLM
jgi:hypothetical protein